MAGDFAAEIDLYDNIDEDFVQKECTDLTELFDDVIVPSSSEIAPTEPQTTTVTSSAPKHTSSGSSHIGRRVALYIGNITWWTTDVDLTEAINGVGVDDVVEVKFHENRQNGQSKGFCVVVFGSDHSARTVIEKLSKVEIHGQTPIVTTCTKQNLASFEKAAGGDSQTRSRSEDATSTKSGPSSKGAPLIANPASLGFSLRNNTSLMGQATPTARQLNNSLTNSLQQALSNSQFTQLSLGMSTAGGAAPSTATIQGNPPSLLPSAFNLSNSLPAALTAANAHVNPNFLQQQASMTNTAISNGLSAPTPLMQLGTVNQPGLRTQQFDHYGRPVIHTYTPSVSGKLMESEFEDIFQRNKTVSSSAINRAVQDAAGGDYASAIETLVTAISLIKQSKIASDDRCKILINSLQDTLHGIESKSYGSKSSRRRRRRSYSGSGSDGGNGSDGYGGGRSSRRYRDRSHRSRSRDRHERHPHRRHSRDRPSGSTGTSGAGGVGGAFYATQPLLNPLVPGTAGLSVAMPLTSTVPGAGSVVGSNSDRCRDTRYRH